MRSLTYFVAVSLDGFIAAEGGRFDMFSMEGDHIDALFAEWPETLPAPALAAAGIAPGCARFDTVLMGWDTFAVGLAHGLQNPYPHLRQVVCSRTRGEAEAGNAVELCRDPTARVRSRKAEPGEPGIWLCGGGRLASALSSAIAALVLKVSPVTLGAGIPLFAEPSALRWTLEGSRSFRSGVVFQHYRRA